jgi:ribA/ribD-fused uncharacterized protein
MELPGNWFSNFLPFDEPLVYQGIEYSTPEHYYQAMKTHDVEMRQKIAMETPGRAKRLGAKVILRSDWDAIKLQVMETALRYKFAPGTSWHKKLEATGDEEIVEWNNWHDKIWGRCVCSGCNRQGENLLGKLLMKLRTEYSV